MAGQQPFPSPTQPSERNIALDALRGFAILGILIMNIQSFSMIGAAYINPTAYGDFTGIHKWVWIISHVFADQKFLSIFSIMFGTGIILFTERLDVKGLNSLTLHYRRTIWLIIIGLIHAYLFWYGDILVTYGLCGLIVILFRKLSAGVLLIAGVLIFSVASILYFLFGLSLPYMPAEAYDSIKQSWLSTPEIMQKELLAYRSGWLEQMELRVPEAIKFQTFLFLILMGWRAGGLMLVGMALYKWGILTAGRSKRFYMIFLIACFIIGFPMIVVGVVKNFKASWSVDYAMFFGSQYNYWGSLLVALGYVGLIMLIAKLSIMKKMLGLLSAVGRMALTNYLLQTLICTTIFYGHGFGLFGRVERLGQILIVFGVWIVQLLASPIWLRYYQFGPAEWLWRSLTYWKLQPMRIGDK